MKQRAFGANGTMVSDIGLGTWQLGGTEWGEVSDEQALATLKAAADAGVTFLDTADIYGMGRSEQLIGRFLAEHGDRSHFFIATKLGLHPEPGPPDNFTEAVIRKHTEASLQRLGVEKVDLTQTHCIPIKVVRQGEVWAALRKLQDEGLIGAFGASVQSMDEALACLNVEGMASLQIIFNMFRRKPIEVLFDKAQAKKVAIIVRLPLASGLLSGKMKANQEFDAKDHRHFNRDGEAFSVGETFSGLPFKKGVALAAQAKVCVPVGLTMAQFALRWCLDFEAVTTVIPGAKRPEQATENARASDLPKLSQYVHDSLRGFYEDEVKAHIRGTY